VLCCAVLQGRRGEETKQANGRGRHGAEARRGPREAIRREGEEDLVGGDGVERRPRGGMSVQANLCRYDAIRCDTMRYDGRDGRENIGRRDAWDCEAGVVVGCCTWRRSER